MVRTLPDYGEIMASTSERFSAAMASAVRPLCSLHDLSLAVFQRYGRIGAEITRIGIEGDLDNPACKPYQQKPLSELREPPNPRTNMPSTSTCWWLYQERRKKHYELPSYTREMLQADYPKWEGMLGYLATGLVLSITASALVYGIGVVVAWALRGFRHPGD